MRHRNPFLGLGLLAVLLSPGCSGGGDAAAVGTDAPMAVAVRSDAFAPGGSIPAQYTCDGKNVSPPLSWTGVPNGARALVLIVEDPDAPMGTFTHWVVFDLAPEVARLPEGVNPGATVSLPAEGGKTTTASQGTNDFKKLGYGGPCPPSGTHRYFFRLFALDAPTGRKPGTTKAEVLKAMKGHILARGELMGKYARSR